eukprot:Plantae.Rhodophyta-Rhodochaete_pulchella.ctg5415.p1 GENE.Plantae.Rhodophyta-Rhodochaete_pulchella.ctg5415~~Plantae.Rhodophyta-Rhodochaete_pulchella.ctg5415.p1  ORF type:complete len:182 (+),score=12.79 Plantae.Rhodophyta-Rhodochaete_pulchella.ctg5415:1036-1581(+)
MAFVHSVPTLLAPTSPLASHGLRLARVARRRRALPILSAEQTPPSGDPASTVVLESNYKIPLVLLGATAACLVAGDGWTVAAVPFGLVGVLLLAQTTIVRFVFTDDELCVMKKQGSEFVSVRGWKYSDFVNWEIWWMRFPVLCYFKEKSSYEGRGSIHFFPIVFNATQLRENLESRTGITK